MGNIHKHLPQFFPQLAIMTIFEIGLEITTLVCYSNEVISR